MHKRIIWILFFAAFVLDYFRSRTEKENKSIPKNIKESKPKKEIDINDISTKPKEKMNAKLNDENDEELEDIDEISNNNIEKSYKTKKNNNKIIDLRIEFCQS